MPKINGDGYFLFTEANTFFCLENIFTEDGGCHKIPTSTNQFLEVGML